MNRRGTPGALLTKQLREKADAEAAEILADVPEPSRLPYLIEGMIPAGQVHLPGRPVWGRQNHSSVPNAGGTGRRKAISRPPDASGEDSVHFRGPTYPERPGDAGSLRSELPGVLCRG